MSLTEEEAQVLDRAAVALAFGRASRLLGKLARDVIQSQRDRER